MGVRAVGLRLACGWELNLHLTGYLNPVLVRNSAANVFVPLERAAGGMRSAASGGAPRHLGRGDSVATNPDGTLTVLSASVRITASSGINVCSNLGTLPASIAVGTAGSPEAIPTAGLDSDEIADPDTGGYAPLGNGLVMLLVMIVGGVIVVGGMLLAGRRRLSPSAPDQV